MATGSDELREALRLFYNERATCPGCPKVPLVRSSGEGELVMECAPGGGKKCSWRMVIKVPQAINVFRELAKVDSERLKAIYGMVHAVAEEERDQFEQDKGRYLELDEKEQALVSLIKSQEEAREHALLDQGEAYDKLQELYYKRQEAYKKTDKDMNNAEVLELVRSGKGDAGWLEWLEVSKDYVKANREYQERKRLADQLIAQQDEELKRHLIHPGQVISSGSRKKAKAEKITIKKRRGRKGKK